MDLRKTMLLLMAAAMCISTAGCGTVPAQPATEAAASQETEAVTYVYLSDPEEYVLSGLTLGAKQKAVTRVFGEPDGICYDVGGTYQVTEQRMYRYLDYADQMVLIRKFLADGYEKQNGLCEIEAKSGKITTKRGVKTGDSVQKVTDTYGIQTVWDYPADETEASHSPLPVQLIYERKERVNFFSRGYFFDYGDVDKIAFVTSEVRSEQTGGLLCLIFLFEDEALSRIILTDLSEWYP